MPTLLTILKQQTSVTYLILFRRHKYMQQPWRRWQRLRMKHRWLFNIHMWNMRSRQRQSLQRMMGRSKQPRRKVQATRSRWQLVRGGDVLEARCGTNTWRQLILWILLEFRFAGTTLMLNSWEAKDEIVILWWLFEWKLYKLYFSF